MAYSEGQLNGAADYRVGIEVWYSGVQDWGLNRSRFDWRVWLQRGSNGFAWGSPPHRWYASIGGVPYSGEFNLNQSEASVNSRVVGSGSTWHDHDANGYRPGFASDAYIDSNHSNVGDGGSGQAWVDAPRIPKPPAQNGAPTVSNLLPTSVTLSWPANGNNNGAAIDQYLLRINTKSPSDSSGYTDYAVSASTLSRTVTGLTPGQQYYASVYAHNQMGYSPKSADVAFKTPSGFYVWNGASWRPSEVFVWNGTAWRNGEVFVWDGDEWRMAT